jgi:pimeloyl-ACP methyl ester carboxylesterase
VRARSAPCTRLAPRTNCGSLAVGEARPGFVLAFDLPGFGLSDAFDYRGRSLRDHAVAQLASLLDALDLGRVPVIGTSLGGMWALCLAVDAPGRVSAVASLGVPAVALPGMRGEPARRTSSPTLGFNTSRRPC